MGMYTEIYVNVNLKSRTPTEVLSILSAICNNDSEFILSQDKPLMWAYLFCNGSCYLPSTHCGQLFKYFSSWALLGKGDLKNYNQEIEQFFVWLMPWIDAEIGEFIGYQRYEECPRPKLYFKTI